MQTEINQQLIEANQQFSQLFSSFDASQINKVPYKESWTLAQVAEHVSKSEKGMLQALHTPGKKADRDPFAKVEMLKNTFLDFSIKLHSPDFIIPEQKEYNKQALHQQLEDIASQLAETIQSTNKEELVRGLPFGDITKGEIIHFIVYHTQRHIHQLQHIFETLNDKTKAMSATHEVIIRKVNDAFRENDVPTFLSYCTEDICWNRIGFTATQGKEEITQMMNAMTSDCAELSIHTIFSEEDNTACTGTFKLADKQGTQQHFSFCDIYKFAGDKIKVLDAYVVEMQG